jgi:hypothetical protein
LNIDAIYSGLTVFFTQFFLQPRVERRLYKAYSVLYTLISRPPSLAKSEELNVITLSEYRKMLILSITPLFPYIKIGTRMSHKHVRWWKIFYFLNYNT